MQAGPQPTDPPAPEALVLHASCVAFGGRAVLILGRAGSGKSSLALTLMAYGARLVADDRTEVRPGATGPLARAPAAIAGRIEARGVGILHADALPEATLAFAVDLDRSEASRLPEPRRLPLCGHELPLLHKVESLHFAPAVMQYLRHAGEAA